MRTTSGSPKREGYVLIMTLVMITVAALSLTGLARHSLLLANESITAQRDLQRYWGANSCRRLLLDQADEIFLTLEEPHLEGKLPWPAPRQVFTQIELAGMQYRLWLSDEDAKLNLNTLTARLPQQRRPILGQITKNATPLQLEPGIRPAAKQQKRWFSSWGQIVDVSQLGDVGTEPLLGLAAELTCWGSGKLNIRRASDETLQIISSKLLSQQVSQKLIAGRQAATDLEWKELLKTLALRRRDALKLRSWFTDRSTCYGLWLELDDGQRLWYHQWVVGDRASATSGSVLSFRW